MQKKKEYQLVVPLEDIENDNNDKNFKPHSFLMSWIRQNYVLLIITANIMIVFILFIHPLRPSSTSNTQIHDFSNPVFEVQEGFPLVDIPKKENEEVLTTSPKQATTPILPNIPWSGCVTELPNPDNRVHIVPPPKGPITLVCCNTTKGPLSIEVHLAWAPLGAERFLYMVKDQFFSTNVPLFRALKGFLVQFGISGDPKVHKKYMKLGHLKDDPQWLPPGPPGREINGVTRYQKGYMSYAGAGKNSRDTQLIMAFANNKFLGGGSPWEVPWGQVVGDVSFQTMSKIYTGYGEKPSQGKIMNRGADYIKEEFPLIDFMNACMIVREDLSDEE